MAFWVNYRVLNFKENCNFLQAEGSILKDCLTKYLLNCTARPVLLLASAFDRKRWLVQVDLDQGLHWDKHCNSNLRATTSQDRYNLFNRLLFAYLALFVISNINLLLESVVK